MQRFLMNEINDPYLQRLPPERVKEIQDRLVQWGLTQVNFIKTLDRWFGNFNSSDKDLAFKLFTNVDYYGPDRFIGRIRELGEQVFGIVHDAGFEPQNVVIVTPEGGGDSGHRHAYDSIKAWNLPREQIHSVADLSDLDLSKAVLVLFNDTYGTGKQFTREVWPHIYKLSEKPRTIILVAVTIAEAALKIFREELPGVHIVPDVPARSALGVFDEGELQRLRKLGERVYPKHPLGYDDTALLTAYYFQCPNNSLPLIWADGKNNAASGHSARRWSPLFPYLPKTKPTSSSASIIHEARGSQEIASNRASAFTFEPLAKLDTAESRQNEMPTIDQSPTVAFLPHVEQKIPLLLEASGSTFQNALDDFLRTVEAYQQELQDDAAIFKERVFPEECEKIQARLTDILFYFVEFASTLQPFDNAPTVIIAHGLQLLKEVNVFTKDVELLSTLTQDFCQCYANALLQPTEQRNEIHQRFRSLIKQCVAMVAEAGRLRAQL